MRSPCLREPVRVFLPLLLLYALDAHGEKTYTYRAYSSLAKPDLRPRLQHIEVLLYSQCNSEAVT